MSQVNFIQWLNISAIKESICQCRFFDIKRREAFNGAFLFSSNHSVYSVALIVFLHECL